MPDQEQSQKMVRRERREDPYSRSVRRYQRWMLYSLALVGAVSLISGIFYLAIGRHWIKNRKIKQYENYRASHSVQGATSIKEGTLVYVVTKFVAARKLDDYRGIVRSEESVLPKIENYLSLNSSQVAKWSISSCEKAVKKVGDFTVVKIRGENLPSDSIILEKTPQGWKVDWESFVVHQEVDWDEIIEGKAAGEITVRGVIYPNHDFSGLFFLVDPIKKKQLMIHGGDDLELISHLSNTKNKLFTLKIQPSIASNGELLELRVKKILANGWVIKG